jgi:alpha-tubulin suppressor-like RCC1 family protein
MKACAWILLAAVVGCGGVPDETTGKSESALIGADSAVGNIVYNSSDIVAGGLGHECMLARNGTVTCAGLNSRGQLGDGTTTNRQVPVHVSGLTGQTGVAAGAYHSCSIDATGNAQCWGENTYGQLGNANNNDSSTPQLVVWAGYDTWPSFVQLSGGELHTCGLDALGFVWCWGRGSSGQLGNHDTVDKNVMVNVWYINDDPNANWFAKPALAIAAGGYHTCALLSDRTVVCWGYNNYGQLGDGTTTSRSTPVAVSGLSNVVAISASEMGSCAMTAGGGMYCWGEGTYGQLGNGTTTSAQSTPTPVLTWNPTTNTSSRLTDVRAISAGGVSYHNCAVTGSYGTICWGAAWSGQLGSNTTTNQLWAMPSFPNSGATTVASTGGALPVAIEAGRSHSCARTSDGNYWCWGDNSYGELGNNSTNSSSVPVYNDTPEWIAPRQRLVAGWYDACVLDSAYGEVKCWGWNGYGEIGTGQIGMQEAPGNPVSRLTNVTALAGGLLYFCALENDAGGAQPVGQVMCWGYNGQYNLGTGDTTNHATPVNVMTGPSTKLTDVVAIAPGCAARADGTVWCWGLNSYGQVGNNSTLPAPYATQVTGLSGVVSLSGDEQSGYCAIKLNGTIWCWGRNNLGQLGDGTFTDRPVPVQVVGLPTGDMVPTIVATAASHSCAVITGGGSGTEVLCWGSNSHGQFGNGTTNDSPTPTTVGYPLTFPVGTVALSVHQDTTCVINNGVPICWGYNFAGEVGDGTTSDRLGPFWITNANLYKKTLEVAQSYGSTFALTSDGKVWSWGNNSYGQLGINSTISQLTPTLLPIAP